MYTLQNESFVDMVKFSLGYSFEQVSVSIFKNPAGSEMSLIIKTQPWGVRGILLRNGDFYTVGIEEEDSSYSMIHEDIAEIILEPMNIQYKGWETGGHEKKFIMLISDKKEIFQFKPAESYDSRAMMEIDILFKEYKLKFEKKQRLPFELISGY